jgi:hypothetical protein
MLGHDGLYEEGSVGFHQVLLGRKGAAQYEQDNFVGLKVVNVFLLVFTDAHCKENPIYVFLFWELHGLSPNFHIFFPYFHSDLYIPRIGRSIVGIYKSLTDT